MGLNELHFRLICIVGGYIIRIGLHVKPAYYPNGIHLLTQHIVKEDKYTPMGMIFRHHRWQRSIKYVGGGLIKDPTRPCAMGSTFESMMM